MNCEGAKKSDDDIVRYLSRHLVVVTGYYHHATDPTGPERVCTYSGTVMSFRGIWFLVTAGHVIEDIDGKLATGAIVMRRWRLNDNFASLTLSDEGVPFDYDGASKWGEFDRNLGLDYAIIPISRHDQRLMEAKGIVAVDESRWVGQDRVACDGYMMLGVPEECSSYFTNAFGQVGHTIKATLLTVKSCVRPDDVPEPKHAWFVSKIADELPLGSIVGMSGGPIFGFRREGERLRYWLWAIQSWWEKRRRISFGSRIAAFGPILADVVSRALSTQDKTEAG